MTNDKMKQLKGMLLQSLYDYHQTQNGASYTLPKAMVDTDINSKVAIDELVQEGYATDSGEGTDNLVLAITRKGIEHIENQ